MNGYNIQIEKLCNKIDVGTPLTDPRPISGGLLHRMYDVPTESGRYAVKALNPEIMKRSGVASQYIESEKISYKLSSVIDVSHANEYEGKRLQETDGQFYLIYDFIDGISLNLNEITKEHAYKIGDVVARIHSTDFSALNIINDNSRDARIFMWDQLLELAFDRNIEWCSLLAANISELKTLSDKMNKAYMNLSSYEVICHGDLDPKNVLWCAGKPVIIDWESVGYYNPYHDFLDTALYWSLKEDSSVDFDRLSAFIDGYQSVKDINYDKWENVLNSGFSAKLGWLEYSLKRSLGIECNDTNEQKIGTEQVYATIKDIKQYSHSISGIIDFLNSKLYRSGSLRVQTQELPWR